MIKLYIKERSYQFYEFISQEWLRGRMHIGVSVCKIKFTTVLESGLFDFAELQRDGFRNYRLGELHATIFFGRIEYQLHEEETIILNNVISTGEYKINNKAEEGYYILLYNQILTLNEQSFDTYNVSYIPSIVISEFGLYSIEKVLISRVFELTWHDESKSFFDTLVLKNYVTGLIPQIDKASLWALGNTFHKLEKLDASGDTDSKLASRIKLSLNWFLLAIESSNVNKLISIWIAIESLILDRTTSLKPLRNALSNAYNIPVDKVELRFYVGRIFKLRSDVVHNGRHADIHNVLIEYLSCLYKDLLNYTLQIPCAKLSDEYIQSTPVFVEYINSQE